MEDSSTMKITPKTKKRLARIGQKGDSYENLVNLLLSFKEAHEKQWSDYVDSIMRGD